MTDYQSILVINIKHEYYNAYKDELASVEVCPVQKTQHLLRQYGMLLRSGPGFAQLIVEKELFSDLASLTRDFHLRFYLVSTDPVLRSITKMPNMFDISYVNAVFVDDINLNLTVSNWMGIDDLVQEDTFHTSAICRRNLIGVLDVHIPGSHFTLERKSITIHFKTISTYWKYYISLQRKQKDMNISCPLNDALSFTEQEDEKISGKTVRIFLSNNEIPLTKSYGDSVSLSVENKILIKTLPYPVPERTSTLFTEEKTKLISHIYVN